MVLSSSGKEHFFSHTKRRNIGRLDIIKKTKTGFRKRLMKGIKIFLKKKSQKLRAWSLRLTEYRKNIKPGKIKTTQR